MFAVQEHGLSTLDPLHRPLHAALQCKLGNRVAIGDGQVEKVHAVREHYRNVVRGPVARIQHVPNASLTEPRHAVHHESPANREFLVHPTQVQTVTLPHQIPFLRPDS